MQKNISTANAIVRITCGLVGLVWSMNYLNRHRVNRLLYLFIAGMSVMKIAEGIARFCPCRALYNKIRSSFSKDMALSFSTSSSHE
ncbi:Protein of unknown function [Thermoactinomyces sp. DSM 45891]|uniref:YgaP family membrane protein n=1 Tax=Thermoactinomyces sp. DSM 45891 TaxID=1761907 RepID=UPI0009118B48|nr:DUF2892 domain-containing protein [Thermoactinomyces sp. DSM 45891]SFX67692.1 Protein of unknown function [Thermoactinomyces sp. DSM 45891]